ncbi:YjzC family protein [Bacillus sp. FJAT-27245]|uniref:YjzC family protein n=1 Tax=Bacillus sp. FJAT-27245 TaxID=1684144 RepID=UPI0006A7CAEE|nr:YjzC family protein [Bacillus sp. FJAT-27245]
MGQNHQFKPGQKAPNNGTYIEIGDSGSQVMNPRKIYLKKGQPFPEGSNHERIWAYTRKP